MVDILSVVEMIKSSENDQRYFLNMADLHQLVMRGLCGIHNLNSALQSGITSLPFSTASLPASIGLVALQDSCNCGPDLMVKYMRDRSLFATIEENALHMRAQFVQHLHL